MQLQMKISDIYFQYLIIQNGKFLPLLILYLNISLVNCIISKHKNRYTGLPNTGTVPEDLRKQGIYDVVKFGLINHLSK